MAGKFKFTFGPWNIHEGADPFDTTVHKYEKFSDKLTLYKKLGFDGVQFHDEDAIPDINNLTPLQILNKAKDLKKVLDDHGLVAEFVAPRLWKAERTIDRGYTSNDKSCRKYAIDRSKRAIDIANELGTDLVVLKLAHEEAYIAKCTEEPGNKELDLYILNSLIPDYALANY
jgi:xylose isomerase